MKITITYEYDDTMIEGLPCWAKANGETACGATYQEARKRLVWKLQAPRRQPGPVPAPEEEEI